MVPEPGLTPPEGPSDPAGLPTPGVPLPPAEPSSASYPPPPPPWAYPPAGMLPPPAAGVMPPPAMPTPPGRGPALPVTPQLYVQFYRAPAYRWWKPLAAAGLMIAFVLALGLILGVGYAVILLTTGQQIPQAAGDFDAATLFITNNVIIAAFLPLSLLVHWIVFRQRPRWLSSIAGRFRWSIFWRFAAIVTPFLLASLAFEVWQQGGLTGLSWGPASLVLLVAIVVTTPFQAAAEEYFTRGLLGRAVGSWFANPWVALVVSTIATALVFMAMHGAGDPWLNAYYVLIATVFAVLVWRTGGLEAAVALHVVNNLVSEMFLPFSPDSLAHLFDRQAGVAGPEILIQMGITLVVAAVLVWQASRLGLPRATAPAATVAE